MRMIAAKLCDEFAGADFGDSRLSKRARSLAEALGERPNLSIPAALTTKADLAGCYRFFNNDNVTPDKILRPHIERTYERVEAVGFALLVQDTTEIDLTRPQQQVRGAGPMDCESRRGAFFHPMIAFDVDGVPLGIVGHKSWTREKISKQSKQEKQNELRQTPIEDKESYRWLEGLQAAERTAAVCPETTCVCVGDSEADVFALMAAATHSEYANLQLLIRAGQNRNTTAGEDWAQQVRRAPAIGSQTVSVRARTAKTGQAKSARNKSREARTADLEIRKATVELSRPIHGDRRLPTSITVNVVLCEEPDPPAGADAISWMLVTTLPIASDEDVQRVISSYCTRWQIEVYFRTLKSGCRIERRRFETLDRVLNCLAFYSVVAWRVMYMCHLGRQCPELDCEVLFEPSEWKSVYAVLGETIPATGCPSLNEVVRMISRLGGFIDRRENHPGTQTLWVGLQRSYDLSNAWNTFGPGSKNFSAD